MYIFGGTWQDFIATFFVGVIGYASYLFTQKLFQVPYLDSFAAAFVIGLLAYLAVHFHLAVNIDNIIIGAVMPLVPGVAITNSFRDILAGHPHQRDGARNRSYFYCWVCWPRDCLDF